MRLGSLLVAAALLAGCGSPASGGEGAQASDSSQATPATAPAPAPASEVTDEKIGLAAYPGAQEVEFSRVKLSTDIGDTYTVVYQSTDSPAKVAAFYEEEGAKLGKLKERIPTGDQMKAVSIDRDDGSQSSVRAMIDAKGRTVVSIHRFFPAK